MELGLSETKLKGSTKSFQAKFGKIGSVVQRGEEIFKLFLICQNESIGRAQ